MRWSTLCCALWLAGAAAAQAATLPSQTYRLPAPPATASLHFDALDLSKLGQEDDKAAASAQPYRYAIGHAVKGVALLSDSNKGGIWTELPDGRWLWRLAITAEDAVSLDLGFSRFRLPHGAELWFSDAAKTVVHGPYTDADNARSGELWLPMVPGESAVVELLVPAELREFVQLELARVNHGYRGIAGAPGQKSGTCNVDTACTLGDAWRDQIRSVGRYTFSRNGSSFLCTGQLVNRTSGDRDPLFLTANHCLSTVAEANSVVVYWKYESASCRTVNSANNGVSLPLSIAAANQSGATLVATYAPSDSTLLRLNQAPPAAADAYWSGWDRRNVVPSSATTIHHPAGHEKRISQENDPLSITDYEPSPGGNATTHLKITDWDQGTTEGGSSGGGLWNPEKRLVGTLHGGFAACGNNDSDYYGRLFVGWTGGGSASTRLSDHLAPTGSAPDTLDGRGNCSAPTVTLNANADPVPAGSEVTYTVAASGGSGSYTYTWDIDGDGVDDKTTSSPTLPARYDREQQFNASVRVRDNAGCEASASRAINVVAPRVRLANALGAPTQVCGDGDAVIEPGERWRLSADLVNSGLRATASDAIGLFSKSAADSVVSAPRDGYGYAVTDSSQAGQCAYNFIDITSVVSPLTLTASGSAAAQDDGRSGVLDVSGVNSFNFYGQTINQVVLSTNGYIGTSASTTGGDYSNVCGNVPDADSNGPRIQVLHDDLVAGSLRAAAYTQCPRASEVGNSNQRCLVFQWNNMGLYAGTGTTPTGNFDFQVVIYPQTWQLVYQYRNSIPGAGDSATVGILNPGNSAQQLKFSCNQAALTPNRAVCFYHPQNLPPASADLSKLRLENPVAALGAMAPAATQSVSTVFAVDPAAACGSRYRVGFVGTADSNYGNYLPQPREFLVGESGNCNVSNNCPVSLAPTVNLRNGAFLNPQRPGNGLVAHVVPVAGQLPVFFGAWYTATPDRKPIWYILSGSVQDNQVVASILRYTRNTAAQNFTVSSQAIGSARVQFLSNERILLNYNFDGGASGSELMVHGFQGLSAGTPNRTGAWFYPLEDGWGQTYDSYLAAGSSREFIASYLYDSSGAPSWVLTDGATADGGDMATNAYRVHCPGCGWTSFLDTATSAGTMRRSFSSANSGTLSTAFTLPAPAQGTWNRNAVPITILTVPQSEQP